MESKQNLLNQLPDDVLLQIIYFLEPRQVDCLMKSSRFFYQFISSEYRLSFPVYSFADFNITWLNNHEDSRVYWELKQCADSPFGKVAQLHYVWWLDLRRKITNVSPGNYKILCRVKLDGRIGDLNAVNFIISSELEVKCQRMLHFKNISKRQRRQWVFLPVGEIGLERCSDLDVALYSHTNTFKCGLRMDFMALVKASSNAGEFDEEIKFMQRYFP
jgi:hypothetical protein